MRSRLANCIAQTAAYARDRKAFGQATLDAESASALGSRAFDLVLALIERRGRIVNKNERGWVPLTEVLRRENDEEITCESI
jgi:hypothetical protein